MGIKNTINGSTGNDVISLESDSSLNLIKYASGYGNDIIYGFKSDDTLSLSGVNYTRTIVGNDVIFGIGTGSITLSGASDKSINVKGGTLSGGSSFSGKKLTNYTTYNSVGGTPYDDTIINAGNHVSISTGDGDDSIRNTYSSKVTASSSFIDAGNGNDTIINNIHGGDYTTVNGGAGSDIINNRGSWASILGGAGNDSIQSTSYSIDVTINPGAGNDTVKFDSIRRQVINYNAGDGNDVIYGFQSITTINIASGTFYTTERSGSDTLVKIGSGTITLKDYTGTVNVAGGTYGGGSDTNSGGNSSGKNINNSTKNSLVSGSSYADTITNSAGGVTIQGGGGNDSIYTSTIYTIKSSYGYVTIDGGTGNDTINSFDPNMSINGGADNDVISLNNSSFSNITVKGGNGNDTIYGNSENYGVLYQYSKGDGNDIIYNFGASDTLSISGASYTRSTLNGNVLVKIANSGTITLSGASDKTINIIGTKDDDDTNKGKYLNNSTDKTNVSGSNYADTVNNYGNNVTVNTSGGNDTILNSLGDYTSINAGNGNDSIFGNNNYTTISGGAGKDTISGNNYRSKLSGDGDNDLISITTYSYNTLEGGDGADTIYAGGNGHSVLGGAGNDKISLSGDGLTINGGTGNDSIYGNTATSHLYEYTKGDGNDLIYNYGSKDSITISGSTWSTTTSGNNVLVKIANSGTITLNGAKGKTLNIYPAKKSTPTVITSFVTPQEIIKKFMSVLDTTSYVGAAALSQAVSTATNNYFSNIQAAIKQMKSDCEDYNKNDPSNGWKNFLLEKCGINLDNDDTGALVGYDAGASSYERTASSIVYESSDTPDNFTKNKFTANNATVQLATANGSQIQDISYNSLSSNTQRYIWQAAETWWIKGALDLVAQTYGNNYSFNSSANKLYFGFFNQPADANGGIVLNTTTKTFAGDKLSGAFIRVNINSGAYGSLENGGNSDGKRSGKTSMYLDRVIAHEMTHAVMMINIDGFNNLPQFIAEGTAELTHGIDDDRKPYIQDLAKNSTYLEESLDLLDTGTGNVPMYAAGYMFLRYLAKQGSEHYASSNVTTDGTGNFAVANSSAGEIYSSNINGALFTVPKDFDEDMIDLTTYPTAVRNVDATTLSRGIMIVGSQKKNSIAAGSGNDTILSNSGNDVILGGAGNDKLYGEAGNDSINGGAGNDTISGGTDTDTLTGGKGNDIFVHLADSEIITDYTPGEDKIKLSAREMSVTGSTVKGSDVVLEIGAYGLITVKGGKGKEITILDEYGNATTQKYAGSSSTTKTVTDSTKSPVTVGSAIKIIDASKRTNAVKITGNKLDNTIKGGSKNDTIQGGAGKDYIAGNAGNDSLIGNAGNDTLIGGNGADKLYGNADNDSLVGNAGNDILSGGDGNDKLYGSAGADKLYGGNGKDSLWGGTGNDTLWGGDGSDMFTYLANGGTDYVMDYESGELFRIYNEAGTKKTSFSKSAFSDDTLTLSINGGGTVIFNDVSTSTEFNINGTSYKVSGSKLAKK